MSGSPILFGRPGDRLVAAERNAVILYARGAKQKAAEALGWKHADRGDPEVGDYEDFIKREIERIREKAAAIAQREPPPRKEVPVETTTTVGRTKVTDAEGNELPEMAVKEIRPAAISNFEMDLVEQIDGRIVELTELATPYALEMRRLRSARREIVGESQEDEPLRVDEREVQPIAPEEERLDEREEEVPPSPRREPEGDPEDAGMEEILAWARERGRSFRAGELANAFPSISRGRLQAMLRGLRARGDIEMRGTRASARYFLVEVEAAV